MRATLLLLAALASAQPQSPAPAAPAKSAAARKSRGKTRASSTEGPDLDAAANRQLSCPPGFIAEKTDGPHLTLTEKTGGKKAGKKRTKKKKAADESGSPAGAKTRTLSRRCVPAAPAAKP